MYDADKDTMTHAPTKSSVLDGVHVADELGAFVPGPRAGAEGAPGGPLSGMRFVAKDLYDVAGTRTGAGNPDFLADAPVAVRHAPAVRALLADGAELVGKTLTDELAFSLSGTNVHYGTPLNSAAPDRVPGGSSSGSASAVAGGAAELALGTDTGGSIRVPASYCGIFGLRPTHARISCDGVVPLAPSLDTVGLFAVNGETLRLAWGALLRGAQDAPERGGARPAGGLRDSAEDTPERSRRDQAAREITTLMCPPELLALLDPGARLEFESAADELGHLLGLRVVERSVLPPGDIGRLAETFRAAQLAEAWKAHGAWIERRRPRLGPGVASRFQAASRADPRGADQLAPRRFEIRQVLAEALGDDELLLQPSASGPAPVLGLDGPAKDDLRTRTIKLTALAGVAGAPVISLPLAEVDGLPLGLAVVALPYEDDLLVECAARVTAAITR